MSTPRARLLWSALLTVLIIGSGCSAAAPPVAQQTTTSAPATPAASAPSATQEAIASPATTADASTQAPAATAQPTARATASSAATTTQPVTERQIDNLVAFTRLLGYVRYFHPSDAAAETDWDRFTMTYIEQVIDAPDAAALAERLRTIFTPYAPTLRLTVSGETAAPAPELALPATQPVSVTMWVHVPLGTREGGSRELAAGERVQVALNGNQRPTTLSYQRAEFFEEPIEIAVGDPATPYQADLGGGVTMALPTALYADASGTLPRSSEPPALSQTLNPSGDNRATRLMVIAQTWNALQHLYSYWDVAEVDWDAALRDGLQAALADADARTFARSFRRFTALVGDGHTFTRHTSYPTSGASLPPFTWDVVEDQLVVTTVLEDAALRPGDVITTINGQPAMERLAEVRQELPFAGQYGTLWALREIGSAPEPLSLTVRPADGGAERTIQVERSSASRDDERLELREPRPAVVAQLADGIVYVDLTRLTDESLPGTVEVLSKATGIVFDMRGYPRGNAPVGLLGYLSDKPLTTAPFLIPVITRPDHQAIQYVDVTGTWAQPQQPQLTANRAFIIDGNGTVSYAESILGIVEGHKLGALVGTPSAGMNGNALRFSLPGGYQTGWTGLRVTKFDGSPLYRVGITPTLPVTRTIVGVAAGRDELLDAAFEQVADLPAEQIKPAAIELPEPVDASQQPITLRPFSDPQGRFTTVVPEGWSQGEENSFSRTTNPAQPAMVSYVAVSASEAQQERAEAERLFTVRQLDNVEAGGRTWTRYQLTQERGELGGYLIEHAAGEQVYQMGLLARTPEVEQLYTGVLLPALEAFTIPE